MLNCLSIYRLSTRKELGHFKHVYFFCSHQDTFVPYYSARVQVFKDDLELPKANKLFEMNQNMLEACTNEVVRVDVNYDIHDNDLSALIGRTAHMNFITNTNFLSSFVHKYRKTIFA